MNDVSMRRKLSAGAFVLAASLACTCGLFPFSQTPEVEEIQAIEDQAPLVEPNVQPPTVSAPAIETPLQERVLLDSQDRLNDGYDSGLQFGGISLEPWADITAFQVVELSNGSLQFVISFNVADEWQAELSTAQEMYKFPPESRIDLYSIGFYNPNVDRFIDEFFDVDNLGQQTVNWTYDPGINEFQGHYYILQGNEWAEGNNSFITVKAEGNSLLITTERQNWMDGIYVYVTMAACAQDCLIDFAGYEPTTDLYELILPPSSSSTQATITMENNLDVPVCYVHINSSIGVTLDEVLVGDGDSMAPGEILTAQVAIGEVIDIQIHDCNDEVIDEQYSITVTIDGVHYPFSPSTGLGED